MKIELRDYQKDQVRFLEQPRFWNSLEGRFFNENAAIQSPTGSGKTYMMLSFIKNVFDKGMTLGRNIFIAVPNIDLCYQTYEEAKKFLGDDKVHILMGKGNVTCYWNCIEGGGNPCLYDSFDRSTLKKYRYGYKKRNCGKCKYAPLCKYDEEISAAKHQKEKLIVTNFSTLLSLKWIFDEFSFGFIDECQMFEDFFDSHNTVEISKGALIGSIGSEKYQLVTEGGRLNALMASGFLDRDKGPFMKKLLRDYSRRDVSSISTYFWEDERTFYKRSYFEEYGLSNCCLVSATVDEYARRRFSVPYDNLYIETGAKIVDYSNSTFSFCGGYSNEKLEEFLSSQIADHGIFLSTRLDLIKNLPKEIAGYEVVHSKDKLVRGKRQLLAASRSYFQGIDIEDLGFLILNKVPFRRSDDVYRNKCDALSRAGYNVWSDFIVGNTVTETIQAMGRLWRNSESQGNVIFFEDIREGCRNYIMKKALKERRGIKILGEIKYGEEDSDPLGTLYERFDKVVSSIDRAYETADDDTREKINVLDSNVYWLNDTIYDALCDSSQNVISPDQVEEYRETWNVVDSLIQSEDELVKNLAEAYSDFLSMADSIDRKGYRKAWLDEKRKAELKEAEKEYLEEACMEQLQ